jgi:superfamily II DNA or RNA helicase
MVIVDELHHSPCLSWSSVLERVPARYRYGASATPWRRDRMEWLLPMVFGPARAEVTKAEVEDVGGVVPATVCPVNTDCRSSAGEWRELIEALARDDRRNALLARLATRAAEDAPVLLLTDRIAHAEELARRLEGAVLIHGQLSKNTRDEAFTSIRAGARITIATSHLLGEGIDLAGWGVLLLGLPMASRSPRVLQAIGRIVRPAPGKMGALVIDPVDPHQLAEATWRGRATLYRRNRIHVEPLGHNQVMGWLQPTAALLSLFGVN